MRFQVPQFIEIEDKIFGPLTFKQFVYVVGGGGIVVLLFFYLPNFLAFLLALPVAGISAALAFYKINNRPFIVTAEAAFKHFFKSKIYVWKKKESLGYFSESAVVKPGSGPDSSLKDKTFLLGVSGGANPVVNESADSQQTETVSESNESQ